MKKIWSIFNNRSMRSKLFISFSVPVIILSVITMMIIMDRTSKINVDNTLSIANKSFDQAVTFLGNYFSDMIVTSESIVNNLDIVSTLSADDFLSNGELDERYREYISLGNVLKTVELSENTYQAKLYLDDKIIYTNDGENFDKYSKLKENDSYDRIMAISSSPSNYIFTTQNNVSGKATKAIVDLVSVYRLIYHPNNRSKLLAVLEISTQLDFLKSIAINSQITQSGVVFVLDENNNLVLSSNTNYTDEIYREALNISLYSGGEMLIRNIAEENFYCKGQLLMANGWSIYALIPETEILKQSRDVGIMILFSTFAIVVTILLVSYFVSNWYVKRLDKLRDNIHMVRDGVLTVELNDGGNDEISDIYSSFLHMTKKLAGYMEQQYASGKAVKSAELKALQAQINPHFLYNTLDLINWEAFDHDAPEIAEITQSLAKFYRISLNKGRQIVTIAEELEHIKAYIDIQNHHFAGNIGLTIDVPQNLMSYACLNIILQPIVENSIVHGIAENPDIKSCNINIYANTENDDIILYVKDNGPGIGIKKLEGILADDSKDRYHGYGVKNINTRIKIYFGEKYGLKYDSVFGKGTVVAIRIPRMSVDDASEIVDN